MRQALAALVTLVMVGSPVWAQTEPPVAKPAAPVAPPTAVQPTKDQPTAVEGKVKTLDLSSKTLTLDDGTTLTIPESVGMTGLKEGTRVIVTYKGNGDQKVVTSLIQVRESPKS